MDKQKVLSLGKLARIGIRDEEAEKLSHEFEAILGYVGEVSKLTAKEGDINKEEMLSRNSMREDGSPHESGIYTERIISQAPGRQEGYFKVKKVL